MKLFGILILSFSFAFGSEIELWFDWMWGAKGRECFLSEEIPLEELSILQQIRRKLLEKGDDIRSWEVEVYRPWLLSWKEVRNWRDFKHWLGFDLPRREAVPPEVKYWIFWDLGTLLRNFKFSHLPKEKMILMLWEPPTVQAEIYDPKVQACFSKIFTWDDDLVDNVRFFKFHYPVLQPRVANIPAFEEKKFCIMICRRLASKHPKELYLAREKVIRFFEDKPGELDLYGAYWEKRKFKNWKGILSTNKLEKLKEYKFSICYENTHDIKGYVTEKIFDCFAGGVVPIYWGASNICDYVPADCFIDRRQFQSDQQMYEFLKVMSKETYEEYLERAGEFLLSEKAKLFSKEHFVESFLSKL